MSDATLVFWGFLLGYGVGLWWGAGWLAEPEIPPAPPYPPDEEK